MIGLQIGSSREYLAVRVEGVEETVHGPPLRERRCVCFGTKSSVQSIPGPVIVPLYRSVGFAVTVASNDG